MVANQPNFIITFKELAVAAIQKQKLGKVIMILDDSTTEIDRVSYKTLGDVKTTDWTADNYNLITLVFLGNPSEVICIKKEEQFADIQKKLNYYTGYVLVYPDAIDADFTSIKNYLNAQRQRNNYSIAILGNPTTAPDAQYIINFATTGIKANLNGAQKDLTPGDFTARVAGAFSGLPNSRSLTYYELPEVFDCDLQEDPDEAVADGKLIIIQQDGSFKLGRGVNSLTTLTDGVTEAFQKIRIANIMDMIANDIITTFRTTYVGKYVNNYSNKLRFVGAINAYLNDLASNGLLESANQNKVRISYDKNKQYLEAKGKDTSNMSYQDIIQANTVSNVFLDGVCSPTDTMEDLDLGMYLFESFEDENA
ncbi:MAG: hypothetical protein KHX03_09670 [Clostridium sp.]|nr:hypothetical protein [Clostridium sp.]